MVKLPARPPLHTVLYNNLETIEFSSLRNQPTECDTRPLPNLFPQVRPSGEFKPLCDAVQRVSPGLTRHLLPRWNAVRVPMSLRLALVITARRDRCKRIYRWRLGYAKSTEAACGVSFQRGRLMVPQYPFNTETAEIWRRSVVPSARPLSNLFFSVSCLPTGVLPLRCLLSFRRDVTDGMWVASRPKKGTVNPCLREFGDCPFFSHLSAMPSPVQPHLLGVHHAIHSVSDVSRCNVCAGPGASAICVACPDGSLDVWTTPHGA